MFENGLLIIIAIILGGGIALSFWRLSSRLDKSIEIFISLDKKMEGLNKRIDGLNVNIGVL